jgi:hypothetical protein
MPHFRQGSILIFFKKEEKVLTNHDYWELPKNHEIEKRNFMAKKNAIFSK